MRFSTLERASAWSCFMSPGPICLYTCASGASAANSWRVCVGGERADDGGHDRKSRARASEAGCDLPRRAAPTQPQSCTLHHRGAPLSALMRAPSSLSHTQSGRPRSHSRAHSTTAVGLGRSVLVACRACPTFSALMRSARLSLTVAVLPCPPAGGRARHTSGAGCLASAVSAASCRSLSRAAPCLSPATRPLCHTRTLRTATFSLSWLASVWRESTACCISGAHEV
jgi:hypothetical protein